MSLEAVDQLHPTAAGWCLLITCEHGGNEIPGRWASLFAQHQALLASHRGYDPGALDIATALSTAFDAPLISSCTSRLLIDLNRSLHNPGVWSEQTASLSLAERSEIIAAHYLPYRQAVSALVDQALAAGKPVLHLSSHSFTPSLNGKLRHADVGLLYDPGRPGEVQFAQRWRAALLARDPSLRVRRNYPYAGRNDGLTRSLRQAHPPDVYLGLELELNHVHLDDSKRWARLRESVVSSLQSLLC